MADRRISTGSRDDLLVDVSRCMLMRFSESGCRRCADICPHGAVTLDGGLAINPEKCRGCLLCTTACQVGALEQKDDFPPCLAHLSKADEPILGCIRTNECSNAAMACLGGLSEEHLLTLCHSLAGRLTLNLSSCGDCPNNSMIAKLEQRLESISAAGLSCGNCRIDLAKSVRDIHFRDMSVDRRGFFKSFGNALFKNAAVILSITDDRPEYGTEYAEKRLPIRRKLLNKSRANTSSELAVQTMKHFDSSITFDESCTKCLGCVAICPTGALQAGLSDSLPTFDQLLCTGCGLCAEFCFNGAVKISAGII